MKKSQTTMEEALSVLCALLFDLTLLLLFYLVAGMFLTEAEGEFARFVSRGCLLLLPLAISDLGIRRIRHFFLYLFLAAAVTVSVGFLTANLLTTVLTFGVFCARATAKIRLGKMKMELAEMPGNPVEGAEPTLEEIPTFLDVPRLPYLAAFVLVYVFQIEAGGQAYLGWTVGLAAAAMFLLFLFRYADGMEEFLDSRRNRANVPVKALKRGGWTAFLVIAAVLAAAMAPALLMREDPLARLTFEQALEETPDVLLEDPGQEEPPGEFAGGDLEEAMAEAAKPPRWLAGFFRISQYVLGVLIFAIVVWALLLWLRSMARYYAGQEGDQIIYLKEEERETEDVISRRKGRARESFFGERMRVRRKYRRMILRNLRGRPRGNETPTELERAAGLEIPELHRQYERARYGAEFGDDE